MQRCCGLTRARTRCSNMARFETTICKATFPVCKMHQNKRLLSQWEREITRRMWEGELPGRDEVPLDIETWVNLFHECWQNTRNIYVSGNFATATFRHPNIKRYTFDKKHKLYTESRLSHGRTISTCGICLEERRVYSTECDHTYCKNCMQEWLKRSTTCPQCRRIL